VLWVGLYLLHLLIATLGVGLATAILLEAILKPLLGRGIISIATGPYYPLEIVLGGIAVISAMAYSGAIIAFGCGFCRLCI
jgi:hypothetical protein